MITSPFAKTSLWLVWLLLLAGCSSLSQKKVTGYNHMSVYFATTREYDASATPDRAFTKTGTKKEWIFYGTAEVGALRVRFATGCLEQGCDLQLAFKGKPLRIST